jgi:succinate dehydrogenase / fumarate reductase, membrane anchor subunit
MVNRLVIGAGYGLLGWLVQRISAVVLAIYTVFMAGFLLSHRPLEFLAWKALFMPFWMRVFSLLFFLSLFLHAWVGMRNVLMDYVHPTGLRLALEVAVIFALVVYAVWSIQILWGG